MQCKQCNLIEMFVMCRNNKEVAYQCPKCKEIAKISIEEEQKAIEEQQEIIKESEV